MGWALSSLVVSERKVHLSLRLTKTKGKVKDQGTGRSVVGAGIEKRATPGLVAAGS